MSSPDMVADISNGEVDRVVFMLTGCDRCGCLVASEYDGDEH